jgi:hypothetical protein
MPVQAALLVHAMSKLALVTVLTNAILFKWSTQFSLVPGAIGLPISASFPLLRIYFFLNATTVCPFSQ